MADKTLRKDSKDPDLKICEDCTSSASCPRIPPPPNIFMKDEEKTWRTYDGSPARSPTRRHASRTEHPIYVSPKTSAHVSKIWVPLERRADDDTGWGKWKWLLLLALLGVCAIGGILKKRAGAERVCRGRTR